MSIREQIIYPYLEIKELLSNLYKEPSIKFDEKLYFNLHHSNRYYIDRIYLNENNKIYISYYLETTDYPTEDSIDILDSELFKLVLDKLTNKIINLDKTIKKSGWIPLTEDKKYNLLESPYWVSSDRFVFKTEKECQQWIDENIYKIFKENASPVQIFIENPIYVISDYLDCIVKL